MHSLIYDNDSVLRHGWYNIVNILPFSDTIDKLDHTIKFYENKEINLTINLLLGDHNDRICEIKNSSGTLICDTGSITIQESGDVQTQQQAQLQIRTDFQLYQLLLTLHILYLFIYNPFFTITLFLPYNIKSVNIHCMYYI